MSRSRTAYRPPPSTTQPLCPDVADNAASSTTLDLPPPLVNVVLVGGPRGEVLLAVYRRWRRWHDDITIDLAQFMIVDDERRSGSHFRNYVKRVGLSQAELAAQWTMEVQEHGGEEEAVLQGEQLILETFHVPVEQSPCYLFFLNPAIARSSPPIVVSIPPDIARSVERADRLINDVANRFSDKRLRADLAGLDESSPESLRNWLARACSDVEQMWSCKKIPRPRGRPSRDLMHIEKRILEAWSTGRYPTYELLARELSTAAAPLTKRDIARVLDRIQQAERRRQTKSLSSP